MFVQGVCVFEKDLADHRLPGFPLRTTHKTLGQIQQSEQCNMFVQGVCVCFCVKGDERRQNVDAKMDVKLHVF